MSPGTVSSWCPLALQAEGGFGVFFSVLGEKEGCGGQKGSGERGGNRPCAPSQVTRPGRGAAAAVTQRGLAGVQLRAKAGDTVTAGRS